MVDERSEEAVVLAVYPASRQIVYGDDTHAHEKRMAIDSYEPLGGVI